MSQTTKPRKTKKSSDMHQYYREILDCMPDCVYWLDKNCTFIGCNAQYLRLLGLNEVKEIIGKPYPQILKYTQWPEERIQQFKHDDISVLVSAEPVYEARQAPVFDKQGNISYYLCTRIPLFDKDNQVTGLVGILLDISARRKMEEQLEKMKEQLQEINAQSNQANAPEIAHHYEANPPKVLMVEDNAIAQKAGQALLMQLDCHVDVADTGDKAASLFQPGKYDLVLMDIGLEDTSGYVVSKKIRQMEKDTQFHVPIIALTGFEADVIKYDCDDYFMEGALTKPLTSEQAKQIIQHYIYHIDIPVSGLKSIKNNRSAH